MENKKDKYKGFASAAEYVQDIHNRYAAFEAENAEYLAYLKQKEESGELDADTKVDPQDMMNVGEMIKIIEAPEHEEFLENEELAHAFGRMKISADFYQRNEAFHKEMNEGMALLYADKVDAAKSMVAQMSQWINGINEHIAENGSTPDLDERLEQLETAVSYLKQDMALSQLQINALQKDLQN